MSKFNSLKDEVVYRASLDGSYVADVIGSVDDIGWHGLLLDFYGKDYIVREDSQGFVTVESFATTYEQDGKTYRSAESGNAWVAVYDEYTLFYDDDAWEDEPDSYYESADRKYNYA